MVFKIISIILMSLLVGLSSHQAKRRQQVIKVHVIPGQGQKR